MKGRRMMLRRSPDTKSTVSGMRSGSSVRSHYFIAALLICRPLAIWSWSNNPRFLGNPRLRACASNNNMMAKSADDDDRGSLLVSNLHKICVSTDPSSKLKLLLASQSPRRREILDMMGLSGRYTAEPSPLNEEELQIELSNKKFLPVDYARTLAERKAQAMAVTLPNSGEVTLVIGSDTIVDLDGSIMEKPKDESDAYTMIQSLNGKWHQVHTGVAVYAVGARGHSEERLMFSFTETANVKFSKLAEEDIRSYVASKEPMDKAGSYGIQGIGGQLVERIEGDFFSVMGLPMHRLSRSLSEAIHSLDSRKEGGHE